MIELKVLRIIRSPVSIQLPASKSISNRLLILRALSKKKWPIHNLSRANDTLVLKTLLAQHSMHYDVQEAGTVYRFLLPYLCIKQGKHIIKGSTRLMQRPIAPLVKSLEQLGARIKQKKEFIEIEGGTINGSTTTLNQKNSSQFASAILLSASAFPMGVALKLKGNMVSEPYLNLTLHALNQAGVRYEKNNNHIEIPSQQIQLPECTIENDWSSAAFFYQLVAFNPGLKIELQNLNRRSKQGDVILIELYKALGVKTSQQNNSVWISTNVRSENNKVALKFYCESYPDLVPSLAVTCAALGINAGFYGINHLRFKESDRVEALRINLTKGGVTFREYINSFHIKSDGMKNLTLSISTFDDHRIAMAFAPLCLLNNRVRLDNKDCVAKSFPDFWKQLKKAGISWYEEK